MNRSIRLPVLVSLLSATALAQGPCPSWSPAPLLPFVRSDAGAAIDASGRIIVIGGNVNPAPPYATDSCLSFVEGQSQWQVAPNLIQARSNCGVVSDYLGRSYAIGGFTNDPAYFTATCERLDGPGSSWLNVAELPQPLGYVRAVATPDGRSIYAMGGQGLSGASLEVYRLDVDSPSIWHPTTPALFGQHLGAAAMTPSGELVATGIPAGSLGPQHLQVRDPISGAWADRGPVPFPYHQIGACVSDQFGDVFFFGGYHFGTVYSDVWRYSTRTSTWSQCDNLPDATNNMACVISPSSKVYLIGGDAGSGGMRLDTVLVAQLSTAAGAAFAPFGVGCAGSADQVPTLTASSLPILGQTLTLDVGNLTGLHLVAGVIGFSNTAMGGVPLPLSLGDLGFPDCQLYVANDLVDAFLCQGQTTTWPPLSIPATPTLGGLSFFAQALVFDPTGQPVRFFATNAGRATVGL
jgi:hypothetical protein